MKKIIRLNENDLERIVKKVILEQKTSQSLSSSSTVFSHPQLKNQPFVVTAVAKGKPAIKKGDKKLLLTKGMRIEAKDPLFFSEGESIDVRWAKSNKDFQTVSISMFNGHIEVFVYSD